MRAIGFSFSTQLVIFSTLFVCLSVGGASWSLYQSTKAQLEESLARELLAIARSSSPLIDANLIELIYQDESGELVFEDEFEELRSQLVSVRDSNELQDLHNPIYVMRATPDFAQTGMLEFVVMIDPDSSGHYFVGNQYPAQPHNRESLKGVASSSGIYFDAEGAWLSASSPLTNSTGEIVGILQVDRPVDQFFAEARERALAIFEVGILSVLGTVALAILFARRLTAPLQSITKAVRALSRGEFDRRLNIEHSGEIGELAAGFNQMARNLEVQREKLMLAVEDAKVASRAKSDFLSNMSHEIRTPLTAIVGYADLLGRTGQSKADRKLWTRYLKRNSDHLLALVNDILDLSKIEAGKVDIHEEPVFINKIVAQVTSMMEPIAREKLLNLSIECRNPIPREFSSDSVRIRQILINLVGNAIKFTDAGQVSIELSCAPRESDGHQILNVAIQDTGIGISADGVSRIFQPFTQIEEPGRKREGGTGLGLDISSRMAKMLGGKLSVKSELGVGSTFTLRIDIGSDENFEWLDFSQWSDVEEDEEPPIEIEGRFDGCSILIVEDGEHNRRILEFLLTEEGASVSEATDGIEGLEAVLESAKANEPFDLILLDMQMPRMDGYEAAAQIRKNGIKTPIVALTAYAAARDRDRCMDAGCSDYVAKPFVPQELIEALERHLDRRTPSVRPQAPQTLEPQQQDALFSTKADNKRFRKILEPYIQHIPDLASEIESLSEQERQPDLARIIHQVKGSAGGYGFPSISDRAGVVMNRLQEGESILDLESEIKELVNLMRLVRLE